MDPLAFAEKYLMTTDPVTGVLTPMKFTEVDRYVFDQMDKAVKSGMNLAPFGSYANRKYTAGKDAIDGSDVHIFDEQGLELTPLGRVKFGLPPREKVVSIPTGVSGKQVTIKLKEQFYQTLRMDNGFEFRTADARFIEIKEHPKTNKGPELVIECPIDSTGKKVKLWFPDNETTWQYFPEIAKKLGRI